MADRNGLDLAELAAHVELFSVELEVEPTRVSGLDGDIFVSSEGALAAGLQELRTRGFSVDRYGDPTFFAGMDQNEEFARGRRGA